MARRSRDSRAAGALSCALSMGLGFFLLFGRGAQPIVENLPELTLPEKDRRKVAPVDASVAANSLSAELVAIALPPPPSVARPPAASAPPREANPPEGSQRRALAAPEPASVEVVADAVTSPQESELRAALEPTREAIAPGFSAKSERSEPKTSSLVRPAVAAPEVPPEVPSEGKESVAAASAAVEIEVSDSRTPEALEGRAMLRILEHGAGPAVDFAWPGARGERGRLYALLADCYGVRTALLSSTGELFVAESAGPWTPNLDRYSAFLRQHAGELAPSERSVVDAIRRRHPGLGAGQVVRLFPRHVDAVLLGGLGQVLGPDYRTADRIDAHYERHGSKLRVASIRLNGTRVQGEIILTPPGQCSAPGV